MKRIIIMVWFVLFLPLCVWAVDGIWTYNGSDNWTTTNRWMDSQIADGTDGIADFSQVDINGTRTVSLYTNRTIGTIVFGDAINIGNDWVLQRNPSAVLTLDGTSGLPVINIKNRTTTITAAMDGTNGFEKAGLGALILAATNIFTGPVVLNGGQTTLDFSQSLSPSNNIIGSGSALTLAGGSTLIIKGKNSVTNSQTFNGLNLLNGLNFVSVTNGSGGEAILNLGAISRSCGLVDFNLPYNGRITTTTPNNDDILGCYATVGSNDWARNSSSGIVAYTAYSTNVFIAGYNTMVTANRTMTNTTVNSLRFGTTNTCILTLSYTNRIVSGGIIFATNASISSKINGGWLTSGTNELIIIDNRKVDRRSALTNTNLDTIVSDRGSTSVVLRLVSYSGTMGSQNGSLITLWRNNNTYSGGTCLNNAGLYFYDDGSFGPVPSTPQTNITAVSGFNWLKPRTTLTLNTNRTINVCTNAYLVLDGTRSMFTINGSITGGGIVLGTPDYGGYPVILNGSNSITGTIEINNLGMRFTNSFSLPPAANLRLAGNSLNRGACEMNGTFTRDLGHGSNQVAWGSSIYNSDYRRGGFAAVGGPLTVNIGGNGSNLVWGQNFFNVRDYLVLGNDSSTDPVTWVNPINLNVFNGSRYIAVKGTSIVEGVISGYGSELIKADNGVLVLAATNTYGGGVTPTVDGTRIEAGTIRISFDAALGTAPPAPMDNIRFNWGNGVLQAGADVVIGNTRNIWISNSRIATLDSSNYVMTVAGIINGQGNLVKTGSGKVVLLGANDHWGYTMINDGDLVVNGSMSVASSITVTNTGFLGGSGVVNGSVTVLSGSGLIPGGTNSGGTLTLNNVLTMDSGAVYGWRYGSTPGLVSVSNAVTFTSGGTYSLRMYNPEGLTEPVSQQFVIMTWPESVVDPSTNILWTIEKPAGGGCENWSDPLVAVDAVNNRLLLTFRAAGFPAVNNGIGPSSVLTNTAVLNGSYASTGATAEVYIYWGTSDGDTNKADWANVVLLGVTNFGDFATTISNLYYGHRYYYRCYASNIVGDCWSPVGSSFSTMMPAVYSDGLRGSIFLNAGSSDTPLVLTDAAYNISASRVLTGYKAGSVLVMTETPEWNLIATGEINGWVNFPGFNYGSSDYFITSLSGQFVPRVTGIHSFRWSNDDRGMMYIDLNDDGVFQAGEGSIAGVPAWDGINRQTLTADHPYNFIFMAQEFGGGQSLNFYITEPGQSEVRVNTTLQAGMWKYCIGGAGISSAVATSVGDTSAVLNATLSSSGTVSEVWAYWGPVDCTNVVSAWANSAYVGSFTNAVTNLNYAVNGLYPDTQYYLRFRITNALMDYWSEPQTFKTAFMPVTAPYSMKITFSGYDKAETLTNFPVLVTLSESITNFYYNQIASSNAADLRFTDETMTNELSYEIESWDPGDGLVLWLKSDAGVVTNSVGNVVRWEDQSGLKNDAWTVGGFGPLYLTNQLNSQAVLSFNNSYSQYLRNTNWAPGFNLSGQMTYFFVSKIRTNGNYAGYFAQVAATGYDYDRNSAFDIEQNVTGTGTNGIKYHRNGNPSISVLRDNSFYRIDAIRVNAVGAQTYLDGVIQGTSAISFAKDLDPVGYAIAARLAPNVGSYGKVDFAEIILYRTGLTDAEMNRVGFYLEDKYGLTTSYTPAAPLPTSGQSRVWVKVPQFTNNCSIWAHWGNTNAAIPPVYTTNGSTWSEGYLGVWHMQYTNVLDSTANRYNSVDGTASTNAAGFINWGQGFNGSTAYRGVGNVKPVSEICVEAWAYATSFNQNSIILGKNPANTQWQLFLESSSLKWKGESGEVAVSAPSGGNWHYLAGAQSGSAASLYVDGLLGATNTIAAIGAGNGNVEMGRYFNGYYYNGVLDEVRVSGVKRSSNWLWACWMNQASNNVFAEYARTVITVSSALASNIATTSAVLNVTLGVGGSVGEVWAFWGMSDGGTNPAGWAFSNYVGTYTNVLSTNISCTATGLLPDTVYYFSFLATNEQDTAWSKPSDTLRSSFASSVYSNRMKLTFSGYGKSETLTNFPALVTLGENLPGFLYSQVKAGATDLRFADETEALELNYEIDTWDTNGSSHVWVQVPALTNNCSIWAYWGYSNATIAPSYTTNGATWDYNFRSVWHLNEQITDELLTGSHYDSSANSITALQVRNSYTNGQVGEAQYFDGNDYINCGNNVLLRPAAQISISAWVNASTNLEGLANREIYRKDDGNDRHLFAFQNSGTILSFGLGPSSSYTELDAPVFAGDFINGWHLLTATYNGSVKKIYRDGVEIGSENRSGALSTAGSAIGYMAAYNGSSEYLDGSIDEFRIESAGRSSNWVWACWMNQQSAIPFITYIPMAGVRNVAASSITETSAVLNATLYASNAALDVLVYWNTNDFGTNAVAWVNSFPVGSWTNVDATNISCTVTDLTPDVQYYFKFRATNSIDDVWALDSLSFRSLNSTSYISSLPYRMQIAFSGYDKEETLTNFPALVVLKESPGGFSYSQLQPGGADLRFTNELMGELSYEIESWNTNGNSYVWVLIPELVNYYRVWVCWGGTNIAAPSYTTNGTTWNADFRGVWHLNSDALDSTTNHYNGSVYGGANSVPAAGLIGNAWSFDGLDNSIRISRMIQDDFTIAFWMKATANSIGGTHWYNGSGLVDADVSGNTNDFGVGYNNNLAAFGTGNPDTTLHSGITYINDKNWHHIVATRIRSTGEKKIYVDGVDCGTQTGNTNFLNVSTRIVFGQLQTLTNSFNGYLDEIEISGIPRSSNWIWACYMNQASNSVFSPMSAVEGMLLPYISNNTPSAVLLNSANLNGNLVSTGNAPTTVWAYWGTADGGTNKMAWGHKADFGEVDISMSGLLTTNISGLTSATRHYYRFYASNSNGECWAPTTETFSSSRYRMKVQFGGYDKEETLTNFPALVILSEGSNGFSYSQCTASNGGDLRFSDSNEIVMLNHEIEKWNTGGSSYAWVQVPELISNGWVWAYWGGSDTNMPSYSTNGATWSHNYLSVWHFGTTNSDYKYPDSTASRFDGVNYGASLVQGSVGDAIDLNGGYNYVDVTGLSSASGTYTFHYWLKTVTTSGDGRPFDILGGRLLATIASGKLNYYEGSTWRPGPAQSDGFGLYVNNGMWRHVVYVFNGDPAINNGFVYLDGVLVGTTTYTARSLGGFAKIGCRYDYGTTAHFDGALDEFQISNVPRSSNWIWACYMNQGSNALFNTASAVESTSLPVINNGSATNTTMTSAAINGYLSSTGGAPTKVWVYWGEVDGGTNKAAWAHAGSFGYIGAGSLSTNLTGLSSGYTYYYRYYATNSFGGRWAPSSTVFSPIKHQMKIQFNGYDKNETLTNFPALIIFTEGSNGFSYSQCGSTNGSDLRFMNDNAPTILNHEVEKWNTNGDSYVWVQVPQLTNNAVVWVYWGIEGTEMPVYSGNGSTWDSSFRAVWHMGQSSALDSSANANHGAGIGNTTSNGWIGDGQYFNGSGNYIELGSRGESLNIRTSITFSAWLYHNTGLGWSFAYAAGDTVTNTLTYTFAISDSGGGNKWASEFNGTSSLYGPQAVPEAQTWHHYAYVYNYDTSKVYLYHDGVQVAEGTRSDLIRSSDKFKIGCKHDQWGWWNGFMDELRVDAVPRSSNWLWACYLNQASNASFMTFSAFISNGNGATDVTANSARMNGMLLHDDGVPTYAWVYYGQTDGGTVATNWQYVDYRDQVYPGLMTASIGALEANKIYYYRYFASNAVRSAWVESSARFFTGSLAVKAVDADASEIGINTGTFSVYRPVSGTNIDFTVNYIVNGTASNGVDYSTLSGNVVIPAGQTNALITITPIEDLVFEPDEMVSLTLSNGGYVIGSPSNALVTIHDYLRSMWICKMKITFPGYTNPEGEILTNFPALVTFSTNITGFSYSGFTLQNNAGDLRFVDSSETFMLNYEIEKWDIDGESHIWVQIPQLVDSNTYIWAYWGNNAVADVPAYTTNGAAWDSNYRGVVHLHETSGMHSDSSMYKNICTPKGGVAMNATGVVDGADSFYGPDGDDYVELSNSASLQEVQEYNYTVEAWFRPASVPPGSGDQNNAHYGIIEKPGCHMGLRYANNQKVVSEHWTGDTGRSCTSISTNEPGTFFHAASVVDRTTGSMRLYVNGRLETGNSFSPGLAAREYGTATWKIGIANPGAGTYRWPSDGKIDEVRISSISRSSNWMWACYLNQASNSTFSVCSDLSKYIRGMVITIK